MAIFNTYTTSTTYGGLDEIPQKPSDKEKKLTHELIKKGEEIYRLRTKFSAMEDVLDEMRGLLQELVKAVECGGDTAELIKRIKEYT